MKYFISIYILFNFAFCQNKPSVKFQIGNHKEDKNNILYGYSGSYHLQLINLKNADIKRFNYPSQKNWFYDMGPYNDVWGSDILKVHNKSPGLFLSYFPFSNPILSFNSFLQNKYSDKNQTVYLNLFGFNVKKIKHFNTGYHFYGSE